MGANPMPAAEVEITDELVRALLRDQHPDLADLALRFENEGWDNAIYRLGDALAVRLPRREMNAVLLPNELIWMPLLAPNLPLAVNAPLRAGAPGHGYPWPWSVAPWFEGASWGDVDVLDPFEAATVLGFFVHELGVDAPDDAPTTPYRGGPLTDRDAGVRERVAQLGSTIDAHAVSDVWEVALAAPPATRRRWVHGDLHPANIVIRDGEITAVIDWVDLSGGDNAYDLAAAWICFPDPAARAVFAEATGFTDEALWVRSRGCALSHGLACLASSADNPRMHAIGQRTLDAVLTDPM